MFNILENLAVALAFTAAGTFFAYSVVLPLFHGLVVSLADVLAFIS